MKKVKWLRDALAPFMYFRCIWNRWFGTKIRPWDNHGDRQFTSLLINCLCLQKCSYMHFSQIDISSIHRNRHRESFNFDPNKLIIETMSHFRLVRWQGLLNRIFSIKIDVEPIQYLMSYVYVYHKYR